MTRYLVDTHVWLWIQSDPDRLREETREIVQDVRNSLLFSAASAWEIAIKYRLGKLQLPEAPASYVPDRMRRSGT
ncbi:MAG: type II toxin-antitoxin system VapC family toxin, partial [Mycobacterium sp.]